MLEKLRKELHQKPELSGKEEATAQRIVDELKKSGADEIIDKVGGTGVIARFLPKNKKVEKRILIRAELDAIAVHEETNLPYQSETSGVMHGCGHDGHMTILIGLAKDLNENRTEETEVILLFQPAEETGEGAERVLNDKRFQDLAIDHAFALHNLPGYEENSVIIRKGGFAAASTGVEVNFKGKSSHAAYPEQGLNPSLQMAEFIYRVDQQLEDFKNSHPINKAVNTFIKLGEPAYGINPGEGQLGFTLRSQSDDGLAKAWLIINEIKDSISDSFEGKIEMKRIEPFAATVNSEDGANKVQQAAKNLGLNVEMPELPFPWSEDFGEFGKKMPITLFGLGAGKQSPPLHSEKYDFNDKLLGVGTVLFKKIIQDF